MGLDGLAGSRNAGPATPAGPLAGTSKGKNGSETQPRAGVAGSFDDVLTDVSRPGSREPEASAFGEPRKLRSAATAVPRVSDRDPERPSDASDPQFASVAFVDQASGTDLAHDAGGVSRGAPGTRSDRVRREASGLRGATVRPNRSAFGRPEAVHHRAALISDDRPDSGAPVAGLDAPRGSSAVHGPDHDLSATSAVHSPGSSVGPELVAFAPGFAVDTRPTADPAPGTSMPLHESIHSMPAQADPESQGVRQPNRDRRDHGMTDGGIWQRPETFQASSARGPTSPKPDFAEANFDTREERSPFPAVAREKMTVLAAETHFPPASVPSPVEQIIHRVVGELGSVVPPPDQRRPAVATGNPADLSDGSTECIRSLTLLLEPVSLGPVTIKLRLSGRTIGLEIEADDHETTRLIGRSRHALTEKLRALGLSVDSLVVADAEPSRRYP